MRTDEDDVGTALNTKLDASRLLLYYDTGQMMRNNYFGRGLGEAQNLFFVRITSIGYDINYVTEIRIKRNFVGRISYEFAKSQPLKFLWVIFLSLGLCCTRTHLMRIYMHFESRSLFAFFQFVSPSF